MRPRKNDPACQYGPLGPPFRALNLGPFFILKTANFALLSPSKGVIKPQKGSKKVIKHCGHNVKMVRAQVKDQKSRKNVEFGPKLAKIDQHVSEQNK